MATQTEQLVVALEARVRDFERSFQKANRTANDNFQRIEKRAKQSGDRMEKSLAGAASRVGSTLKNFGAGFAGGILGGLSVAGLQRIASSIGDVAKSVAMIGSNAKMAGLTTKAFQELGYVAEQSRISVDTLADGMKELALRADEWITTGGGAGAEAFQRLGYGADELKVKLKDPSALLVDIIARLQQLDKAAQIRIADELFGGSAGERFVELLDRGANGIRAMIAEAHSFGLVLDDDVIARADEIDRKFNLISRTIGTRVKGAIVSAAGELFEFMDKMREVEERQSTTLGNQLSELGMRRLENENAILKLRDQKDSTIGGTLFGAAYDKQIEHLEQEQREIAEAEARILKILADRDAKNAEATKAAADAVPDITKLNTAVANTKTAGDAGAKGMMTYADAIRALKGEIPELAEEVAKLDARAKIDKAYSAAIQNARTIGEANQAYALRQQALASIGKTIPGKGGATDTSDEAAEKARQQIEAYADIVASAQEFIAVQGQEAQALGMSADAATAFRYEMDMLNAAKRDGIDLTADQRNEIAAYAQGMAQAEKITQQFVQSQEDAAEVSRFFGEQAVDALSGLLTGTTTARDALRQLISALIRAALQAAFLGEGPLAALFPGKSIFGRNSIFSRDTAAPSAVQSIAQAPAVAEQTFPAPVGEVTRAALAPIQSATEQAVEGLRGSLDAAGAEIAKASTDIVQGAGLANLTGRGNALAFLQERAPGKAMSHLTGLKTDFQERLAAMMQDAPGNVTLFSGYRSPERQRQLWDAALKKYGSPEAARKWVAPPGRSMHNSGMAADLGFEGGSFRSMPPDVQKWVHENAGRYGLKFPMDHEPWHVEPVETRGGQPWQGQLPGQGIDTSAITGSINEVKTNLDGLGTTMQTLGTSVQTVNPNIQTMGVNAQQLGSQVQAAGTGMTSAGSSAQVAGTGFTMAGTQTQMAGASAQTAGPQFTQAGQAIMQAGVMAGQGAAAAQSGGGLGGLFGGGGLGMGLLGLGLGLLPLLFQSGKKKKKATYYGSYKDIKSSFYAEGGHVSGPGTSTSDSIPAMLSDGEFVVNAKATKKHRAALEAINAGRVPALATGGIVGRNMFAPSSTYAPSLAINVTGSGDPRQDRNFANLIADHVDRALKANQPKDTFRRSESQILGNAARALQRDGRRQG